MKKFLLLALAALCVSAAQAVTYTWSNCDDTATSSDKGNYTTLSISFFTDSTVTSTLPATGNVLLKQISLIRRDSPLSTNPATIKLFDGTTEVASATVTITTDDLLNMSGPGLYTRGAYNLIFDDDAIIDVTKTYTIKGYDETGTEMTGDVFGVSVVRNDAADQWIAAMRVTAESTVPEPEPSNPGVPEPTALALLALGVAGLALKRKVA